jgi:hypothetical protein
MIAGEWCARTNGFVRAVAFMICLLQVQGDVPPAAHRAHGKAASQRTRGATGIQLTTIARKVADVHAWELGGWEDDEYKNRETNGSYTWVNDHTVLYFVPVQPSQGPSLPNGRGARNAIGISPHPVHIISLDTRTGTSQELTAIEQLLTRSQGLTDWLQISPDHHWFAWPGNEKIFLAPVDGGATLIQDGGDSTPDSVLWFSDSRRFVLLGFQYDELRDAYLRSGARFQRSEELPGGVMAQGVSLLSALLIDDKSLLCISDLTKEDGNKVAYIIRVGLHNSDPNQVVRTTVHPPPVLAINGARPSSHGERIAWLFLQRIHVPGSRRSRIEMAIWISDGKGKRMHELGWLPVTPKKFEPLEVSRLRWLPDDRHLSFVFKDSLYVVPAN